MWHQWLRHTRRDPPSLDEQKGDVVRQEQMKYLAAEADARWEAKPRVMEAPRTELQPKKLPEQQQAPKEEDPWAKAKAKGPGENWQPEAWDPTKASKK